MKRDLELIRRILLAIENSGPQDRLSVSSFVTDTFPPAMVSLHIKLLLDCDYIEAFPLRYIGASYDDFIIKRITSNGYDYLDSVKNNTVWNKTKEKLSAVGGEAALDVVKEIGKAVTLNLLGI